MQSSNPSEVVQQRNDDGTGPSFIYSKSPHLKSLTLTVHVNDNHKNQTFQGDD